VPYYGQQRKAQTAVQEVEQEFSKVEAELECMQQKLAVTKKELDIARSTANETQRTVI
jgi:hypothetical protein